MKFKRQSMPGHAMQMLLRNFRSYSMLSVTIVLSFSILLGYLAFIDTTLYNDYKELFCAPYQVVLAYQYDSSGASTQAAIHMAQKVAPDLSYYCYFDAPTQLTQYDNVFADLTFLPNGNYPVFKDTYSDVGWNAPIEIKPIQGREQFRLRGNEAIVNESLYYALGGQGEFPVPLSVPFTWSDGSRSVFQLEIVGVFSDRFLDDPRIYYDDSGHQTGRGRIFLSQTCLGEHTAADIDVVRRDVLFQSQDPEAVAQCVRQADCVAVAAYEAQNDAMTYIRIQKATKAVIAAILLVLLGTNLYSSFVNALDSRKFEIGVKRAIGAPASAIVRQFLLEGLAVMVGNILLSVLVVTSVLSAYKGYQALALHTQWIINVSPYSAAVFCICSIALTVVFSLLFAYKSTQVEIVQYLKAE